MKIASRRFGPFTGKLRIRRAAGVSGFAYGEVTLGESPGLTDDVSGGFLHIFTPKGSDNPYDAFGSKQQIGKYVVRRNLASLVVASGVATVTLAAPFDSGLAPGELVFIVGMDDMRLNNPHLVASVDSAPKHLQFRAKVEPGVADGTYRGKDAAVYIQAPAAPYLQFMPDTYLAAGSAEHYVKSGKWDPNYNRITFWIKLDGVDTQRFYVPSQNRAGFVGTIGTYTHTALQEDNGQGVHWYHQFDPNWYGGVWQKWTVNRHPDHQVGTGGAFPWPNNPTETGYLGLGGWLGGANPYMNALRRWYIGLSVQRDFRGSTLSLGPVTFSRSDDEPNSSVSMVIAQWSPARYTQTLGCGDPSEGFQPPCTGAKAAGPGFEAVWQTPKGLPTSYEVRRSTQSLKTTGFSRGLCNDGSTACKRANGDIVTSFAGGGSVMWFSSHAAQTDAAYFGIRPILPVISVSAKGSPIWVTTQADPDMKVGDLVTVRNVQGNKAANQTAVPIAAVQRETVWYRYDPSGIRICAATNDAPIVVTTCAPHRLQTGARVRIDQAAGNIAMNGWWNVTVLDQTRVRLEGSKGNGAYPGKPAAFLHGPGMLAGITADKGTCVAKTLSPHGLVAGRAFLVLGSASAVLGQAEGTLKGYAVVSTPTPESFTFACPGVADGNYDRDADEFVQPPSPWLHWLLSIQVYGAVAIPGTGAGAYTAGGELVSAEEKKNFTEVHLTAPPH
jgi:hypothetical protein